MEGKKEPNNYDFKETENNLINLLAEMFTITEKSALLYEKVKFLTSTKRSSHHRLLLIFCR